MPRRETVWIVIIVLLLAFSIGPAGAKKDDDFPQYQLLAEMIEKIRENYVVEIKDEELFQGALDGVVEALDPYSQYLPPKEAEELKVDTEGEYGGLGIVIDIRNTILTIVTPVEDTPAFEAGILAGDTILKINDESTEGITRDAAVQKLRGRPGTKVTLTILHEGAKEPAKMTLTRARIEVQSVKGLRRQPVGRGWDFWADEAAKIGYIRITQFQEKTMPAMDEAVRRLLENQMKGLILDLRFDPGGLLNVAIDMADRFVSRDQIVFTKGRNPQSFKRYLASTDDDYPPFPLVVLINRGSASASEIVAGCIQDRKRGMVVGTRSFGKGSVQSIIDLVEDHKLKITTAYYYTPSGRNIHRSEEAKDTDPWGIVPDVIVEMTLEEETALLRQRRDSDVIRSSAPENKAGPDAEPRQENGGVTEAGGEAPEKVESAGRKGMDKQLERAIQLLKAGEVPQAKP